MYVYIYIQGSEVLLTQGFTKWSRLHSLPKPHSHLRHSTNVTPLVQLTLLQAGFKPAFQHERCAS